MANQIVASVYQIDGNPQGRGEPADNFILGSFPTSQILMFEATISEISYVNTAIQYYNNPTNPTAYQTFYVSETLTELVAAANVGGTTQTELSVLAVDDNPLSGGSDGATYPSYSFPSLVLGMLNDSSETLFDSVLYFKSKKYGVSSTATQGAAIANSGDYKVYTALLSQSTSTATSGLLIVGHSYTITTLQAGDDFANVGYVSEGVAFTATGTTPTDWTNSTEVLDNTLSAPVATVLQNTLGGEVVWSYDSVGGYVGTLSGAFENIVIPRPNSFTINGTGVSTEPNDNNSFFVGTYAEGVLGDNLLNRTFIQVIVPL